MTMTRGMRLRATRGQTFAGESDLEVMCCSTCAVLYAVPVRLLEQARRDHVTDWSCPNGHSQYFPGREPEEQIEELKDALARSRARRDQLQASNTALRGAATRARNERDRILERVAAGLCPVRGCKRHIDQLEQHLETMHPRWLKEHRELHEQLLARGGTGDG